MTPAGTAFVERMMLVERMAKAGTPVFAALSCSLEDSDWVLVYAAAMRMARDIQDQFSPQETSNE